MSTLKTNKIENLTTTDGGISINNSGNVGIGLTPTTDEGYVLQLDGGTKSFLQFFNDTTGETVNDGLVIGNDSSTAYIVNKEATPLTFRTSNTERMQINSSGQLLVGHDSAADSNNKIEISNTFGGRMAFLRNDTTTEAGNNIGMLSFYGNDSNGTYQESARISAEADLDHATGDKPGRLLFYTTADGASTVGAERMRIDSSGRVLIGTANAVAFGSRQVLAVANGTTGGVISLYNSTTATNNPRISSNPGGSEINDIGIHAASTNGSIRFYTNNDTEAGVIDSSGNITLYAGTPDWVIRPAGISDIYGRVDIGKDSQAVNGTGLYVVSNDNNSYGSSVNFRNIGTGPSIICRTQAGADAFRVESNGDVKSATNSYGSTSDIKFKENIVDASSQWDDVKAIRVRKFNFKEDTLYDTSTQIGVIAQEIETVSPGLVTSTVDSDEDGNDLGTVTKSVKYSVLYMKSVKALQEAMARIEALEVEVAALKSN